MKKYSFLFELLALIIITIPAFFVLLQQGYPTMHDDQHIARLYLFDQGFRQGQLYPRWVDGLGFGFGYPLFNFYPPLIYFVSEVFHLVGFSLIWSVKLMIISGFLLASLGMYLLTKTLFGRLAGILSATLYTYFFYHAVNSYVRGALAEFFSMSVLPFVFLSLIYLHREKTVKNSSLFGASLACLILVHPLIAFPTVFYVFFAFIFALVMHKSWSDALQYSKYTVLGGFIGLALSAFFWIPSIVEKQYTLVNIITQELGNYKLHFIYPFQFLYSLWGYGGSGAGIADGMTFQLGKIHMVLAVAAIMLFVVVCLKAKAMDLSKKYFLFFVFLLAFSLFMTIESSGFIWSIISYLSYLQFPWRFLTFAAVAISIVAGSSVYFLRVLKVPQTARVVYAAVFIFLTILVYSKYFKPLEIRKVTDKNLTSFEEISWRISGTSYEFVPSGVKTTKSKYNTTILNIKRSEITQDTHKVISGRAQVSQSENVFHEQSFKIKADRPVVFRLNNYNFPGWTAYLRKGNESVRLPIRDNNELKLITVDLPQGEYEIQFLFVNTPIRSFSNAVTVLTLLALVTYYRKHLFRYFKAGSK